MSGDPEPYCLKKSWPSALLFGLKPWDLLTLTSAAAHLTVVTLVASLVPSMRAANVNPIDSLCAERAILVGSFTLTFDAQHGLLYLEPNPQLRRASSCPELTAPAEPHVKIPNNLLQRMQRRGASPLSVWRRTVIHNERMIAYSLIDAFSDLVVVKREITEQVKVDVCRSVRTEPRGGYCNGRGHLHHSSQFRLLTDE